MRIFDHVGVPTETKRPGEHFVEETRVWITDPADHPHRIEYLRFEPDSPVTGPVRDLPHMAFRVDNLEKAMGGHKVLLGPFQATESLRVVFVEIDGGVFEFMDFAPAGHWFPDHGGGST